MSDARDVGAAPGHEAWPIAASREPIALRHLTWHDGDVEREIVVRMWQPIYDGHRSYICDVAIDGFPEPIRASMHGADSFQALTIAFQGIRHHLAPFRDDLAWLETRGIHGFPLPVSFLEDAAEERRIEAVVETESQRFYEPYLAKATAREAHLKARYEPDARPYDATDRSDDRLLDDLRAIIASERVARIAGEDDLAFYRSQKKWPILHAIRNRPQADARLATLLGDDDSAVRLFAATFLPDSIARATLEALRDANAEPEAREARTILENRGRDEARPKPWD